MMKKTDWLNSAQRDGNYKAANLESWKANTTYWLSSPLRHVVDNEEFINKKLEQIVCPNFTVVDMGCGDGFLYRMLRAKYPEVIYIGLDFNPDFITHLNEMHSEDNNASFLQIDIEKELPKHLCGIGDVVFNYFVFLEIVDFNKAFENSVKLMKETGTLSIFTIDYTFLILAVSRNMRDFKKNLSKYGKIRKGGNTPYVFQKIDLGDSESEDLTYGSVFYSAADFVSKALTCTLGIIEMSENIQTDKYHPKVYQYFEFG